METKGKAVDSIIQYQLHKESNGNNDKSCGFNPIIIFAENVSESYTVTQEMLDNDPIYNGLGVSVDDVVTLIE